MADHNPGQSDAAGRVHDLDLEPYSDDQIILRLCSYCGQTWREGYTARCGMAGQCNAGRGGPCKVERYRVVAWEELDGR